MKVFEGNHTFTLPNPKKNRVSCIQTVQNCLAKALYDNAAEAPDELAFRKNDILTVLEQNPNGLEGWWLCSLRGRQGIAPGNRLRLLPGMYDPTGLGYASEGWTSSGTYPGPGNRHSRRRSWHINPNKVITPQKIGDVYLYDVPVGHKSVEPSETPHSSTLPNRRFLQPNIVAQNLQGGSYDTPPSPRLVKTQEAYDEPRPLAQCFGIPPPPDISALDEQRSHTSVSSDSSTISSTYSIPKSHDYDVPSSEDSGTYDVPAPSRHTSTTDSLSLSDTYDIPTSKLICDIPASNRSSGVSVLSASSSSFFSPSSGHSSLSPSLSLSSLCGSNRSSLEQHSHELYDIPPPEPRPIANLKGSPAKTNIIQSSIPTLSHVSINEVYDIPANNAPTECYDVPPAPKLAQAPSLEGVYDVPPQVTRDTSPTPVALEENLENRLTVSKDPGITKDIQSLKGKELLLDLDAAMEILVKLQQEVQSAISKLFSFISASWRRKDVMDNKINDIQVACYKIDASLKEFLNFSHGALANSTHAADKTLSCKLANLLKPLVDSSQIVQVSIQALDNKGWQVSKFISSDDTNNPDELDQLVACAQGIIEDVRPVASFIRGNSVLIFKRSQHINETKKPPIAPKPTDLKAKLEFQKLSSMNKLQERPLPLPPPNKSHLSEKSSFPSSEVKDVVNDYEYVNLESKDSVEKSNKCLRTDSNKTDEKIENVIEQSENMKDKVIQPPPKLLDTKDVQMLQFYSAQAESHVLYLTNAIDGFLSAIENNQPPKVFIGHSKFVVISAHKLVYIGDTVQCHVTNQTVKSQVMQCANNLCDSLKTLVANTKKAALQFPSVAAVQEMVDSVVDVSHLANDLRMIILQAAEL
ncbi:breast cancer anti-estrogen resistance protein 1-like isoform X1 [Centruroides sculpturatus]|uniref:breast cancer anti-estrogen resistance protein 1-like isoform X1 n=1 Tax=Centruroides sculpturatus TaxID=218467 RepID=UPI000C6CEAE0|nr:breast cancer anti-estrogen resistance protein 1-like isoform X1 [Centruroides sculpturatus]